MHSFQPQNRKDWRDWLSKNHTSQKEVWLIYFKKDTGKPTISYIDSVEEAICFGWIDGIKKRVDDQRYTHRFSPRKIGSKWSPLNIKLAEKMIKEKKMTLQGLTRFKNGKEYDESFLESRTSVKTRLDPEYEQVLKQNEMAWMNFKNLAPSYQKRFVLWLNNANRESTRQKRLKEALELLQKNKKLGMK